LFSIDRASSQNRTQPDCSGSRIERRNGHEVWVGEQFQNQPRQLHRGGQLVYRRHCREPSTLHPSPFVVPPTSHRSPAHSLYTGLISEALGKDDPESSFTIYEAEPKPLYTKCFSLSALVCSNGQVFDGSKLTCRDNTTEIDAGNSTSTSALPVVTLPGGTLTSAGPGPSSISITKTSNAPGGTVTSSSSGRSTSTGRVTTTTRST